MDRLGNKWRSFSDLDVYGYTEQNILFKLSHDDFDSFYELSFGMEDELILIYRTSLEPSAVNDYDSIICNP